MSADVETLQREVQKYGDFVKTLQMQIQMTQDADGNAGVALDDWLLALTSHLLVLSEALEHFVLEWKAER